MLEFIDSGYAQAVIPRRKLLNVNKGIRRFAGKNIPSAQVGDLNAIADSARNGAPAYLCRSKRGGGKKPDDQRNE